ncbi:MAG: HAD family hydrolase, partial [Acutalibacteraceae bacterium]|nr:HAD family hydrolase [Acutalibacteraceae bacterium]
MKNFKYILFDLDGTITDPGEGITNSVAYSLKSYGIYVEDKSQLYPFIGPPLYASYMKYYGFSKDRALEAVERYREYYSEKGVFECTLYAGIKELMQKLSSSGKKVIIATSKPEYFAKMILEHFGLTDYIALVSGATLDSHRVEKADIIKFAFDALGITEPEKAVMIGDREFDILGAKANGISSVGVTYGYGSEQELQNAGADFICQGVEDIEKLLL